MDVNGGGGLKKHISAEAAVAVFGAIIVGIGAFAALQTSVKHEEEEIKRVNMRVEALENREREHMKVLTRVDQHLKLVDEKLTRLFERLNRGQTE